MTIVKHFYTALFILACLGATSQDIERQKVGHVYLITNYIDWPGEPNEYVLRVITQDRSLATAFKEMAAKRQINGKPIKVSFSSYVSFPDGLDILYISKEFNGALGNIVDRVQGKPILIITEESSDQQYVMSNLIETPEGLSFEYNRANILNSGLKLNSGFDELGGREINMVALYKKARDSVRNLDQKSRYVKEQIDTLHMLTAIAQKVGSSLLGQIDQSQVELVRQNKLKDSLKLLLRKRETQLEQLANKISILEDSITLGDRKLYEQAALISQGDKTITKKESELRALTLILDNQLEILIFLIVFALFFAVALFLAYRAYGIRRKDAKKLNEQKEELDDLLDELQYAQEQLIQAEKLAAVGALTEKITHEVTNATNYIFSGIHIIKKKITETKPMMEVVDTLDGEESNFNVRKKVKEIVEQRDMIEFDSYEGVTENMINNILAGADRIKGVLEDLGVYSLYKNMAKVGLAFLGRDGRGGSGEKRSITRSMQNRKKSTRKISKTNLKHE